MLKDELDIATLPGRTLPSQRGLSYEVLIDVPLAPAAADDEEEDKLEDCRMAWLTGGSTDELARAVDLLVHPFARGIFPAARNQKSLF